MAAGETEATFKFVKAIEGDMEGVWTIGGIKYDFDLAANLEAFETAANQIELNKALTDLGIENVKVENMPAYLSEKGDFLDKLEEDLTVEVIQAWVDKINADAIGAEEEAAIVKAVVDALGEEGAPINEVALLQALQNDAFARVNPEWVAGEDGYAAKLKTNQLQLTSIKAIQTEINNVNGTKVNAAYNELKYNTDNACVDRAELLKAKALIETYATPNDKGELESSEKGYLKNIDIQLAIVDVREASTPTRLKNALIALDELLDKDAKFMDEKGKKGDEGYYAGYVEDNAKLYFDYKVEGKEVAAFKEITKAEEVKPIIVAVNAKVDEEAGKVNALISKTNVRVTNKKHPKATNGACYLLGYTVNFNLGNESENESGNKKTFADTKSVVAEFYKGKDLIGKLELKDPVNNTKVKDVSNADGTLDVFGDYDSDSWKQEWNGKVTDIPTKVVVKVDFVKEGLAEKELDTKELDTVPFLVEAVNRAETAEEMSRALINLEATGDSSDFTNLSKAAKLEVAELVLAARAEEKGIDGIPNTAGKFFGTDGTLTYDGVFNNVKVQDYTNFINSVNGVVTEATDEKPADIAGMKEVLDSKVFLPEFAKLSPADKTLKAEAVLNTLLEMQADKDNPQEFKTIAEIKAAAGL